MANIAKRPDGHWRARYRDDDGREHSKHFPRKVDAQQWLDTVTTRMVTGSYVDPRTARMTVEQWSVKWLEGYGTRRASTVRQARTHVVQIVAAFGSMRLGDVRPSHVRSWTAKLAAQGFAPSYVSALHGRLSQVMSDAVHDGMIPRSPCSRRTSPGAGEQRLYVATTEQVWQLHDATEERYRAAVLLGAFAGLRIAEVCGLRVADVDFLRGIVLPAVQYPAAPLKTEGSAAPIPVPEALTGALAAHVARWRAETVLTNQEGRQAAPWTIERAFVRAKATVPSLPQDFRFHDLRHYYASLLISSGGDVKVVQARLRHRSAKTTLDTYSHLWPDSDDRTRAAVGAVLERRADFLRTGEVIA